MKKTHSQSRRTLMKQLSFATLGMMGFFSPAAKLWAKTYLSVEQAQKILFPDTPLTKKTITLSTEQAKLIKKASKVRVRSLKVHGWVTPNKEWFIFDQIIGKHENIDMAFAYDNKGRVKGMEVLTYRESYGHQIRNPKWRGQFNNRNHTEYLKLDKQIKNISGATLSCRHVVDGINRLNQTWLQVLQHL